MSHFKLIFTKDRQKIDMQDVFVLFECFIKHLGNKVTCKNGLFLISFITLALHSEVGIVFLWAIWLSKVFIVNKCDHGGRYISIFLSMCI